MEDIADTIDAYFTEKGLRVFSLLVSMNEWMNDSKKTSTEIQTCLISVHLQLDQNLACWLVLACVAL